MGDDRILPKVRTNGLVIKELPDEVLVYDVESNTAFCLNRPAAVIMNACDGRSTIEDARTALKAASSTVGDEYIWLAVEDFRKHNMLADLHAEPFSTATVSRRKMIRQAAALGMAIPIISALVVPPAISAASTCIPLNGACTIGQTPICCAPNICSFNVNEATACLPPPAPMTVPIDPDAPPDIVINGAGK